MAFLASANATPWSPPDDLAPGDLQEKERQHHKLIMVMDQYLTPTVCFFGCAGNLLNLIVLNRKKFRASSGSKENAAHAGLVALAVSDLLFCVSLLPRVFTRTHKGAFSSKNFALFYQMYGTGLVTTFLLSSTWTMVSMALVRYLAICFPLRARALGHGSFSRTIYATVFFLSVLMNLPSFWQFKLEKFELVPGEVIYIMDIGVMDLRTPHGKAFLWIRVILGTFTPALLLTFCNCSLIRALQRSSRMRRQYHVSESASSSKSRVTFLLVVILSVFVISVFPCELLDFFRDLVHNDNDRTELFLLLRSAANLLQVLNFAFNFILYCLVNAHFRASVIDLMTCSRYGVSDRNSIAMTRRMSTRVSSFGTRGTSVLRYQGVEKGRRWSSVCKANTNDNATTML